MTIILIGSVEGIAYAQMDDNDNERSDSESVLRIMTATQSDLNITSATSYSDGEYFYIVGEVLNTASNTKEFVKVISTLYDGNKNVIGTEFTYTDPSTIPSTTSAPFKLIVGSGDVSNINSIKSYKIVASDE